MRLHARQYRSGLTLAELLVASSVTALIVAALAVFIQAVTAGWQESGKAADAAQAARVVIARISHKTATSRQVLKMSDALRSMTDMDKVLLIWERDGGAGDPTPGQPNFVELVIYAPHKQLSHQLMELRPQLDPAMVVPMNEPALLYTWIERFRSGQNVVQPPAVLLGDLEGIHFDVAETIEPQGIGMLVQQEVRINLCIRSGDEQPSVFVGSATRRFAPGN